ncbi:MAG: DUF4032 domain-containing protein [Anaerolineales bacterium]|jgi:hypothetical protein
MTSLPPLNLSLRPGHPDFLDLPWSFPMSEWSQHCPRLEEVPRGLSRHPVEFVNYSGKIYAIKEMPVGVAEEEYNLLLHMEGLRLPGVTPVGHAVNETTKGLRSVLITRFLDRSLPYRSLFMRSSLVRYRDHLLDAMAGLMVQLHLNGVYWGDCSLSNTLFRRDAGTLQAYLVDAETSEVYSGYVSPTLRFHDLQIMEENVDGDLADLGAANLLMDGIVLDDTSASIRIRYQNLWEEITRQVIIHPDEKYRIQERIQVLNSLGFSIGEVLLQGGEEGDNLRLRVVVTDRNFHQDQLLSFTGIEAEEMQARQMMNEIHELKATLSQSQNRSTPLSLAAYKWLEEIYLPTLESLHPLVDQYSDPAELYCQVLEHKWYLSERAHHDVGHQAAVKGYLGTIAQG